MALEKKDLFSIKNLSASERVKCGKEFPPKKFNYKSFELSFLGESNKADLKVKAAFDENDADAMFAFSSGSIDQFIYSDQTGELFEALLLSNQSGNVLLAAIRTRRVPDKKK